MSLLRRKLTHSYVLREGAGGRDGDVSTHHVLLIGFLEWERYSSTTASRSLVDVNLNGSRRVWVRH